MASKYGTDMIGIPLELGGETMWVNEQMMFSTLVAIITFLENLNPEAGSFISVLSEKIYDHITNADGPSDRSGTDGEGTSDGSTAA